MIRIPLRASLLCLGLLPALASACDIDSGEREQRVMLEWNGRMLADWRVEDAQPHRVELPNGVALGVTIEPAERAWYAQRGGDGAHLPEMVRVVLSDLAATPAREFTTTWAGANSVQGYGARGGADRVDALGDPGVRLILLKPVCVALHRDAQSATVATPAAASTDAAPASAAATSSNADDDFGRPQQQRDGADEIVSRVSSDFRGWGPNSRIRLENGQEWQIADGSSAKLGKGIGPGARIVRAAFGSYRLQLDGLAKSPKVRRVK